MRRVGDKNRRQRQLIDRNRRPCLGRKSTASVAAWGELQVEFVTRLAEIAAASSREGRELCGPCASARPIRTQLTSRWRRAAFYLPDTPENYAKTIEYFRAVLLRIDPQQKEALIGLSTNLCRILSPPVSGANPARGRRERSAALASQAVAGVSG